MHPWKGCASHRESHKKRLQPGQPVIDGVSLSVPFLELGVAMCSWTSSVKNELAVLTALGLKVASFGTPGEIMVKEAAKDNPSKETSKLGKE